MKISPAHHFLLRVLLAGVVGWAAKSLAARWGVSLPIGVAVNLGLGAFFFTFWFWQFPWEDIMLLTPLEQAQLALLPHSGTRLASTDCTKTRCALAGSERGKCIRMRHMKDQTKKRAERLKESVYRSSAPYFAMFVFVVLVASMTIGNDVAAATGSWQVIQVLLGLLSIGWWLAITYAEVSYQRSLNFDLLSSA